MTSTPPSYVFGDVARDRELARLRQIETALDPSSIRWLHRAPLAAGSACLEVGAGAGSMARWLAEGVGPTGRVVALDLDPTFLSTAAHANVEPIRGDIRDWLGDIAFDLVHARYVLIHLPDPERAVERMLASLRPGGWLVLEEPDFLAARFADGPAAEGEAFRRVNAAIERMFLSRGMDPALGARLPSLLGRLGVPALAVECDAHLVQGGSEIALMMKASTEQLRGKYVDTGVATDEDIEGYRRFSQSSDAWGVYYATVRVLARR
jgi:SAM-dependent methyltransferase